MSESFNHHVLIESLLEKGIGPTKRNRTWPAPEKRVLLDTEVVKKIQVEWSGGIAALGSEEEIPSWNLDLMMAIVQASAGRGSKRDSIPGIGTNIGKG